MTRRLLIFTNAFPYGTWEPYLVDETAHYGAFDEIYVFALSVRKDQERARRRLRDRRIRVVKIAKLPNWFYALLVPMEFANRDFWREVRDLWSSRRLTLGRVAQVLVFFTRAGHEARAVRSYVRREIQEQPGDLATLYAYRFAYQPYLANRVRGLFQRPRLVARAHGADLYQERSSTGYLPMQRTSLRHLDELALVSRHGLRYLGGSYPEHKHLMVLSNLGTVDHGLSPHCSRRDPLRLVSCSTVAPVKRLTLLVESLGLVPLDVRVHWTHFGGGASLQELESAVRLLPDNVQADLRGQVANSDVLGSFGRGEHDVLVNVSASEGLPVSMMESMSFGVPVVGTDVGGVREIVEDGENGLLLPSDPSAEQIAEAVAQIARMSDDSYDQMRLRARRVWEEAFDADRNYARFVESTLLPSSRSTKGARGERDDGTY